MTILTNICSGGTFGEDIDSTIEELNTLFLNYGGISFYTSSKNEKFTFSLFVQWIALAKYRLQQLEATSEEILIHNVIDRKFQDIIKQIQKLEQIGLLRHMRACFPVFTPKISRD